MTRQVETVTYPTPRASKVVMIHQFLWAYASGFLANMGLAIERVRQVEGEHKRASEHEDLLGGHPEGFAKFL